MTAIVVALVADPHLPEKVMLGLTNGTRESSADSTDSAAFNDREKSETTVSADSPSGSTDGSAGGAMQGGASGSGSDGSGSAGKPQAQGQAKPIDIRILWWNDTREKSPTGFEIRFGSQSIKPDISKASGTASIGPCAIGEENTLVIFPDGTGGKRFEVPFTANKYMASDADVDGIHVEISDGKVRVLGNSVYNFEQSFSRF